MMEGASIRIPKLLLVQYHIRAYAGMKLSYFVSIASKSIWKALLMMVPIFASTQGQLSGSVEGIEDEKALPEFLYHL